MVVVMAVLARVPHTRVGCSKGEASLNTPGTVPSDG